MNGFRKGVLSKQTTKEGWFDKWSSYIVRLKRRLDLIQMVVTSSRSWFPEAVCTISGTCLNVLTVPACVI